MRKQKPWYAGGDIRQYLLLKTAIFSSAYEFPPEDFNAVFFFEAPGR